MRRFGLRCPRRSCIALTDEHSANNQCFSSVGHDNVSKGAIEKLTARIVSVGLDKVPAVSQLVVFQLAKGCALDIPVGREFQGIRRDR